MKKLIYIILTIILINSSFSQKTGLVKYGQIESTPLKGPYGPDFNAYLVFNNEASYYVTAQDTLDANTKFKRIYHNKDSSQGLTRGGVYTTPHGRQVYYNRERDTIYWNQWIKFYVAEKTPKINWEFHSETKQIGKFTVNKATGFFRGRTYTAWYTLEIPLPYGPWKLQGLPGLILEAYDKDKEMYCYFKSIEYPTTRNIAITQITRPKELPNTWKTLDDFKKRLNHLFEKRKNNSIMIAQKYGTDVPEQKIKSEIFLESFPE